MTDLPRHAWRKASRSGGNNGNCVELATVGRGLAVRDSKSPAAGALVLGERGRAAFISGIKAGKFDA